MRNLLRNVRRKLLPGWNDEWQKIIEKSSSCCTVQLGAGKDTILPNAINVDINAATNPHVICDLNAKVFPFRENSFDMIVAISVLEHLDDFFAAMGEIHRIAKPGASVHILVPHFSSAAAYIDPTHKQLMSAQSCDYFITGTNIERAYGFYLSYRYLIRKRYIELAGVWNYLPPMRWLVERCTDLWERHLCFIFRGGGIYWELEVKK